MINVSKVRKRKEKKTYPGSRPRLEPLPVSSPSPARSFVPQFRLGPLHRWALFMRTTARSWVVVAVVGDGGESVFQSVNKHK